MIRAAQGNVSLMILGEMEYGYKTQCFIYMSVWFTHNAKTADNYDMRNWYDRKALAEQLSIALKYMDKQRHRNWFARTWNEFTLRLMGRL